MPRAEAGEAFPAQRRHNGHVIEDRRPAVDAPGMTVTGVRVLTPAERLLRAGRISRAQGEAARQFAGLVEAGEAGASPRWIGDRTGGGGGSIGAPPAVLAALQKLRRAEQFIGPDGKRFLRDVLVLGIDVAPAFNGHLGRAGQGALTRSVADQRGIGMLAALLEVLVWHWRIVPRYAAPRPRLPV